MTAARHCRRGYSLIEMLGVMVLLVLLGGILTLLLHQALAMERTQGESLERSRVHVALADQFRSDAARAEAAPAAWGEFKADGGTLILQMGTGRHVVYLWRGGRLERRPSGEGEGTARELPVGAGVGVEFVREEGGLVRLRLAPLRGGAALPGQALEIAAAVGGDRR